MKKHRILLILLTVAALGASTWFIAANGLVEKLFDDNDPDMSPTGVEIDRGEYILLRNEQMDMLRGYDTAQQQSRTNSIRAMEQSEAALRENHRTADQPEEAAWIPLGPAPLPAGSTTYSGRVSAIAVHPTNPDIVYVGTAQGGLYRSLNGGATWTALMDSALTLAIGAVAISPSDPTTVYVGTGESTLCNSGCFIGVGLYRITNADTTPVLSNVFNKDASNNDVFTGRAISEILVHPTDPNTIFVGSTSGIAGIGSTTTGLVLPTLGVYRSTNAMSANPTFALLDMGIAPRSVTDLVMEPGNPNKIFAGVIGDEAVGGGGVYATSNALAPAPTFTQVLSTSLTGRNSRVELAATKVTGITTVFAASGQGTGTLYKSVDTGPFTQVINNNFCGTQCFYDIAVAVDPTNPNRVYLGGSPNLVFGRSTNGGTSFTSSSSGLHVDTQAITIAPSNPNIVYFGSDGGIWRTTNVTAGSVVWNTLNNSTFSATQFMGLAIHPKDRNYSLGGTQDNGTEFLAPDGIQWIQSDGGDGGFAVIDQTSPDTSNVVAYHTYFNQTNTQIGFARATSTVPPGDPNWGQFFGCGGADNGINCSDATLFYAPMVGGPNAADGGSIGNTLYFGTDHLYRSIDQGKTMIPVSQALPARISAIAIAPPSDDVRLVGTTSGAVFLSTTADASTLISVTGPIPARYIGRVAIDPTNSNTAYVCLNGFGLPAGQHVWKTTNLLAGTPTWTPAGLGIPDTPVDSFAIDPADPNTLFAGTDIGVFKSSDGGANWIPFSNGLPRLAVFGMAIQADNRVLRIATHGRGMWELDLGALGTPTPTATNTPTATPTATATPPGAAISGTVTYGNAIGAPTPRFVSNVLISGAGSIPVSATTTFPGGTYSLTGFGAGSYTVTPTKTGGQNNITSFDAARIAQHVAGVSSLTGNQLIVADVSGNGTISSFDSAEVAGYVVSVSPTGSTGTWRFSPVNRTYPSITTNIPGQDYSALLMGEVSGNWTDSGARAVGSRQLQSAETEDLTDGRGTVVTAPRLVTTANNEVLVPVRVERAEEKGIISYEFDLRYDPSVLQPQKDPVDVVGTVSRGLSAVANAEGPGLLKVAVYGPTAINASGVLLNLRFTAVGAPGSVSPLTWERLMLNEGNPETTATDGEVTISAAAPNQAEITGRLLTKTGVGIPHARVTLTDTAGQRSFALSNGFGVYRFPDVRIGQTYTLSIDAKRYTFTPVTVAVSDQLATIDLITDQ